MRKRKIVAKPPAVRTVSTSKLSTSITQWKGVGKVPAVLTLFGVVALAAGLWQWNSRAITNPRLNKYATNSNHRDTAPVYSAKVLKEYDHDHTSFTQGLLWSNGRLYESSGLHGQSMLRVVDLPTGKIIQSHHLDAKDFAEGLTIFGEKNPQLLQVLWKVGRAYIYNLDTLALLHTIDYEGDGWGLASPSWDRDLVFLSDGTSVIKVYRIVENKFSFVRELTVRDGHKEVGLVNELEFVEGELWANVWYCDFIARIDPETGNVNSWIDLRGILKDEDIPKGHSVDVLNGIAYDAENKSVFVTGKNWPKLFLIQVTEKQIATSISNVSDTFFLNPAQVKYIHKHLLA